jgi:hypothetical protein
MVYYVVLPFVRVDGGVAPEIQPDRPAPGRQGPGGTRALITRQNGVRICGDPRASSDSGPSRTVIPVHRGQRSGDCGQLPMSV